MKKILLLLVAIFLTTASVNAQSMTDEAVIEYVKDGVKQGKTEKQLFTELTLKGVSKDQMLRIKKKYDSEKSKASEKKGIGEIRRDNADNEGEANRDNKKTDKDSKKSETDEMEQLYDKDGNPVDMDMLFQDPDDTIKVFGRDIFRRKSLTFEPSMNIATPANYRLGPGDQLVIEVWGASETNITQTITPDGYITIPNVGPVSVNGLTVQAASSRIRSKMASVYSGLTSSNVDVSTNVKVSVGQIRTIQVNIMGDVRVPGTYAVSSFSTVFHALYKAGGIGRLGSLRNIKVVRGGKTVATVDVYDYILRGRSHTDIRLQEGDVILVSPYESLVRIEGKIKRPMYYEMKADESLADLINYAGGFTSDAYSTSISLERNGGRERSVCTVDEMNYSVFKLKDGDMVTIGTILDRFENRLEIKGAVYRPGIYQLGKDISTVRELILKADGILEDAFTSRAVLHRENPDRTLEVLSVDVKGILNGTVADIPLQKNDVLFIPSVYDLKNQGTLEILGEVFSPGTFPYTANTKLEDLIIMAGGLTESASTVRVDVARHITDPKSTKKTKEIAQTFSFGVKDGFVVDGEPGFILEPYDQVFVRRSPGYAPTINVSITGEVEFEGTYALNERNERLSDLIQKAGGLSDFAYLKGARLERTLTPEEYAVTEELLRMAKEANDANGDSIRVQEVSNTYSVGIDLETIMKNPHTDVDPVLQDGDVITVPQYMSTVSISGSVRKSNSVTYDPAKNLSYYISQAGGYAERAKKSGTFIIYPNGQVKELGRYASAKEIQPGSRIVVPQKAKSQWNIGTTISAVSASVSMLAVLATMIRTLK